MRANYKRTRNSLSYKIKMWFYRLTFRDVKTFLRLSFNTMGEILIALLGLILLFIIPALFH